MKKYNVYVPICGYVYLEVEAEDEQEAIDKAFENGCSTDDIVEFDMYEHIVQGNVFYGAMNDVDVIPENE